jgi:hypothetical protein
MVLPNEQVFMASANDIANMRYSDVIYTIISNIPADEISRLNSIVSMHNGQPPESVHELAVATDDGVDYGIVLVDGSIHYTMHVADTGQEIATIVVSMKNKKNKQYQIFTDGEGNVIECVRDVNGSGLTIM